jgi:trigger factor
VGRARRFNPFWDYGRGVYLPGGAPVAIDDKGGSKQGGGSTAASGGSTAGPAQVVRLKDRLPVLGSMTEGPVSLPPVKAPSTEGLEVTVPAPPNLTQEDLIRAFHDLSREHAEVRDRVLGEPVAMGDDVQLDILGYSNGQLIPFSMRTNFWMELAPQEMLPGFADAIAGSEVGDSLKIDLVLPANYPVESLRGLPASFVVDLIAAREVKVPDTDSDEVLSQFGRGNTMEEVMDSLAEQLLEEQADMLWLEAQNMVLDQLASRIEVEIPQSLVDEEIRRRWAAAEGEAVAEKEFSVEEQREALDLWLKDPGTRAEVERRLRVSLALKAVAERDKLVLTPEKTIALLEEQVSVFGITPGQLREALVDPSAATQLRDVAWHLMAVEHVMNKAKVRFEGAEEA